MSITYVYPKLPAAGYTFPVVRFSGSGLANCLFVYARAIKYSYVNNVKLLTPAWFNISIGPYLRRQKDKRHYFGLFNGKGEIGGVRKIFILLLKRKKVKIVKGLGSYFEDILEDSPIVCSYIERQVDQLLVKLKSFDFNNCVAVHVRLGDYPDNVRTPIQWYIEQIKYMQERNSNYRFLLFSDGNDDELKNILIIPSVQRGFFGSAIADIFAISKCCYLIGSDSTFSGWGAYLGQVPCIFFQKHYGPVLIDQSKEIVVNDQKLW